MSVEANVQSRYSEGAQARQEALCCPVDYDTQLLQMLPQEIIDKDYGCGDPSRYVQAGDTVLDLGSGGGKICYMAAQISGAGGRVIGVDMTDDMLALARKYQPEMARKLGGDRVEFKKGYIQDLALDVAAMEDFLAARPVTDVNSLQALEAWKTEQRQQRPLIAGDSVDLVVSNCVLNLVAQRDRQQLVSEIFRVLKPGGRVAISDIVSDEAVPSHLQQDAALWSGCISGAFQEQSFLQAFLDAGFVAVAYDKWEAQAWQVVEGIEFRSVTLTAVKPAREPLSDAGQAVIYRGPFSEVCDDLGNVFPRGERIAVSKRTYELLRHAVFAEHFIGIEPATAVDHGCFCKPAGTRRPASETKGGVHAGGSAGGSCC
ncbi:methyltransferase domain-containing protein [Exilibacterium tricleocarpae]|uniref:Arsenite methyltransferase n=1 Tax=Exilibacterium tricleocarpae TaxID=2591008 RepID=A0A545SXC7_9GAMM|nr:methyltransferase domain-containing protein [Exilibacterium tricleocarpae]TQV69617.1 methyltransferase domain-containing protein [Exilibacterium tricleocarpae]